MWGRDSLLFVLQPEPLPHSERASAVRRACEGGRWPWPGAWSGAPPPPRPSPLPRLPGPPPCVSPPSATVSHWLWGDGVSCRHWPCLLVCAFVSAPSWEPSNLRDPCTPLSSSPKVYCWERGEGREGRAGRAESTEQQRLTDCVGSRWGLFISRMLPPSLSPGCT